MPDELTPPDAEESHDGLNPPDEQHAFIPHAPPVADTRVTGVGAAPELSGFGKRLAGYLLDGVIIFLPCFLISRLAIGSGKHSGTAIFVVGMIPVVVSVVYAWAMLTYAGSQTLGMKAVNIRCVEASSGLPVTSGRSFGRAAAWFLFAVTSLIIALPLIVDLLWPLWDKNNQTLHDKVASTYVVNVVG
jgi:uncharacterized RDD family membrane protein YckC